MAPSRFLTSFTRIVLPAMFAALLAEPAAAQTPSSLGTDWVGSVRCDIKATATGYLHEERQTWTLTGAAPTTQGSMLVFPATWTVTGQGTHDRTRNTNRRVAQWVAAVPGPNPPVNAPIAFSITPVTGVVNAQLWHSQLTRQGGYTGTDQFINDGVAQTPNRLVATLYEVQFPRITAEPRSTRLSGTITFEVSGQVGPLQPLGESQVTIACAWELGRGTASPLPPSTTPDVPSSGATSSNNPPANPPGATTPPGSTTTTNPPTTSVPGSTPPASTSPGTTPGGTVPGGSRPVFAQATVSPEFIRRGNNYSLIGMVIAGTNTNWQPGTTTVSFGPGVIVDNLQVNSPTSLSLAVRAANDAPLGPRTVTVTTGSEVVTLAGFEVVDSAAAAIESLNPSAGTQGAQNLSVTVTGRSTHWLPSNASAFFGPGITVSSVTVHSPTSLTAVLDIDPQAAPGAREVGIVRGLPGVVGEATYRANAFTVTAATSSSSGATSSTRPVNSLPTVSTGGGLTATPAPGTPPANPVDPANFTATQTADGIVRLSWSAVPGAGSYMLGGPGTNVGISVTGTSHTLTGIAAGTHTWTVATNYNPGGVLTTADKWSRVTATITNRTARYRISLNGFRVNHETNAGPFGREHNAVYAAAAVEVLIRSTQAVLQPHTVVRSLVHGDSTRAGGRVAAGSASSTGGLLAGDTVPMGENPAATTRAPSTTTFPLLLWEGPLTDGVEVVSVRPTLWVWNGGTRVYDSWLAGLSNPQRYVGDETQAKIRNGDMSPSFGGGGFDIWCSESSIYDSAHVANCFPSDDRPIGLHECNAFLGCWSGVTLFIARDGVERALSSPYQAGGIAPGVIQIHLADRNPSFGTNRFSGNYDLYLRVERLP